MDSPTPEVVARAKAEDTAVMCGHESRSNACIACVALALDAYAQAREQAVWAAAFMVMCSECKKGVPVVKVHDDWEHTGFRPRCDAKLLRARAAERGTDG